MPSRFYLPNNVWDPDKGLPLGASPRRVHPGNALLQGYLLGGVLGYYCWKCGKRPKGRISGPRGAAAKHKHEGVCGTCAGTIFRHSNFRWRGCKACALSQPLLDAGKVLLVAARGLRGYDHALPQDSLTLGTVTLPPRERVVIALGGIWTDRTGRHVHSDTARFSALRDSLRPGVRLFGVAHGSPSLHTTLLTLAADIRRDESWYSSRFIRDSSAPPTDTITRRGATIFILDYFWVPREYLVDQHFTTTLGYGARWFSHLIPLFFCHGGQIVLLPNDKNGLILSMHDAARASLSSSSLVLLTATEAHWCHPLYSATDAITDRKTGYLRGAAASHGGDRSNATQVLAHLDPSNPFCLVYNTDHFATAGDAREHLRCLARMPV